MLYRNATSRLQAWKDAPTRKALLIAGARQIGKTTVVREFAKQRYKYFAELNFLIDQDARDIFSGNLDAQTVISNLTAYLRLPLEPGSSLVLFDEIQECPRARTAIKALVEDGRFDYIETGSLLGVRVNDVPSYPVGFEERFNMYPMNFEEFCLANGVQPETIETLGRHFQIREPLAPSVHSTMLRLFQLYMVIGGMPEVVQRYVQTHDVAQAVQLQRDILSLYRQDITKYAEGEDRTKIRDIFDSIPSQLDEKNRRFVLSKLSKSARQERYRNSFLWLSDAGVSLPCYNVTAPVIPLAASERRNLFKLFLSDVGLLCASYLENVQFDILQGGLDVNLGSIAENVVAQELVAQGFELRYFNDKKLGEVDFIVQSGKQAVPIEVKSGNDWTKHNALDHTLAVAEWNLEQAYVLCKGNLHVDGRVTYLPLYMAMFLKPEEFPQTMKYEVDLSGL